ncbi:hypothetical protein K1719_033993 [Acacia pycnantha]|nr:hypothetical protein K1719_033993 [Acacia pycnantha]
MVACSDPVAVPIMPVSELFDITPGLLNHAKGEGPAKHKSGPRWCSYYPGCIEGQLSPAAICHVESIKVNNQRGRKKRSMPLIG